MSPPTPPTPPARHPRALVTPHVGWLTEQMFTRTAEVFAGNLRRWADGNPPRWAVNAPAVLAAAKDRGRYDRRRPASQVPAPAASRMSAGIRPSRRSAPRLRFAAPVVPPASPPPS